MTGGRTFFLIIIDGLVGFEKCVESDAAAAPLYDETYLPLS